MPRPCPKTLNRPLTHLANKTIECLLRAVLQSYSQLIIARNAYPLCPFDVGRLHCDHLFPLFGLPRHATSGDTEL